MKFSFLVNRIEILAVDDDADILSIHKELLTDYPPYRVTTASSIDEAEKLIVENNTCHLCLMDLGMSTRKGDEYYLLRKYGAEIPFVILSGATSIEKGAIAKELGAYDVIAKPANFTSLRFIHRINAAVIRSIFLRKAGFVNTALARNAFTLLLNNNRTKIAELASIAGISESHLRKVWNKTFKVSPKQVSIAMRILQAAFDYFDRLFEDAAKGRTGTRQSIDCTDETDTIMVCYLAHKPLISRLFQE